MKTKIKIQYRKVTNPKLAVAEYYPLGYRDCGKEVITGAVIKVDPIVRKPRNKRLKNIILNHEVDEINARAKGIPIRKAHQLAVNKEPEWFTKKCSTHKKLQKALRE